MTSPSPSRRPRGQWARPMRRYHRLLGLFFTPAILFFAVTGALQTLELHDARHGAVPAWLANAASLHKHQRFAKPKAAATVAVPPATTATASMPADHPGLRLFVVLMAIALAGSALSGCAIAFQQRTMRKEAAIALIAGIIVPVVLSVV